MTANPKVKDRADGETTRLVPRKLESAGPSFEIRSNLRVVSTPDPLGGPPRGSVDLRGLSYPEEAVDDWGRGTRIQDVVTSILASEVMLAEIMGKLVAEKLNELHDILEEDIDGLNKRLTLVELENGALKSENAGLQRSIAALGHGHDFRRERRAVPKAAPASVSVKPPKPRIRAKSDGSRLPPSIVRKAAGGNP